MQISESELFATVVTVLLVLFSFAGISAQRPPSIDQGYIKGADGIRLFYRSVGNGKETIIYLHGGPGANFRGQEDYIDPLARKRRLIMYDQRGGGHSALVTDPKLLTAAHHVRDLEELRKAFGVERITLVGLSWGSALAALYAAEYPERVDRIVFVSPMAPRRTLLDDRINKLDSLRTSEEISRRKVLQQAVASANDVDTLKICREFSDSTFRLYFVDPTPAKLSHASRRCDIPPAAIRNRPVVETAVFASLGVWDLRPTLKKLSMPTLVLEGENTNVPLDATREFADSLPNSRIILIPNAGHEFFVDQPKLFLQTVERFLKGSGVPDTINRHPPL